jgi:hypothetical protein
MKHNTMKSKYVMICLIFFIAATHIRRDYKPQLQQHLQNMIAKTKGNNKSISFILHQNSFALIGK